MKDNLKFTLLVIGLAAVFFIMGREIIETRTKLRNTEDRIVREKKEKIWLRDELKSAREDLARTDRDLRVCQGRLGFVNKKIFMLRGTNAALTRAKYGLEYRITLLQEEKSAVEEKLHSLRDLKKAIREIKIGMKEEKIKQQKELDKWETAQGNKGFFVKDGETSYRPKVNVEVRPASLSLNKK